MTKIQKDFNAVELKIKQKDDLVKKLKQELQQLQKKNEQQQSELNQARD
jgi:hypothetical protein